MLQKEEIGYLLTIYMYATEGGNRLPTNYIHVCYRSYGYLLTIYSMIFSM